VARAREDEGAFQERCVACLDGLYAFAVDKDNKAVLRKIKVTRSIDGRSVIDEGLSPGEQVITAGQYKVQPGSLVTSAVASSDVTQAKVSKE